MKNPLNKRIPRELKSEWQKYLVIMIFMVIMIGLISGMYVGHDSMLSAVYEGRDTLNLEDGSFELDARAPEALLEDIRTGERADVRAYYIDKGDKEAEEELSKAFGGSLTGPLAEEALKEAHNEVVREVDKEWNKLADRFDLNDEDFSPVPVKVYEHFFREEAEDYDRDGEEDANIRIYKSDSAIDKASFNEGRAPSSAKEIAIDRMHADNVGVTIGDTIAVGGRDFKIVGLLSYVNYLTLHENNTDLMFDAFGFDVGMVTPEAFDQLTSRVHFGYAFKYADPPETKIEQADYSENFLKALTTQTLVHDREIEDYLPEYLRQASNFAPTDIEGDLAGTSILCYILIAVIAFIFAITINNTIDKEASVIGTLRASGYSRKELIIHYMSMPVIVTLAGALIGNILGYTAFRNMAVYLYYNSYSLPVCHPVWSNTAMVKTTVTPLLLMFFINLFVIVKKMRLSPLRFLRHDLAKSRKTRAMKLPGWSFFRRFRLRIILQNLPNYLVLIFGIIFIELMMCFAFGLPDSLNHYAAEAPDMMFAEYQYMLMDSEDEDGNTIETAESTAERFGAEELLYSKPKSSFREGMGSGGDEKVTVYGISDHSEYVKLGKDAADGGAYISSAFASKFKLAEGDTVTLHEEYENRKYDFKVKGLVDYDGGIAVFLDADSFNRTFDKEDGEFSGYFSRHEITDIDDQYIGTVITEEDVTKVTTQLMHSMGGFMGIFKYALIVLTAALIYLLAKIIIEKNEHAISMAKILGFKNSEISSLYMLPTAIMVGLFSIVSLAVGYYLMIWIFHAFMLQLDGYFEFFMKPSSMVLAVLYMLIGYAFVSLIDFARIRRIPPDVALKNVE